MANVHPSDPQSIEQPSVVVLGDGGQPGDDGDQTEAVEQPAKVMRIGSMIKQLLEEVRQAPLDEASRTRLACG